MRSVIGPSYDSVVAVINILKTDDTPATRDAVSLVLDPIVKDLPTKSVIAHELEQTTRNQMLWIMGIVGVFLFVIGAYFGMKEA